jgi:hypothetical protein
MRMIRDAIGIYHLLASVHRHNSSGRADRRLLQSADFVLDLATLTPAPPRATISTFRPIDSTAARIPPSVNSRPGRWWIQGNRSRSRETMRASGISGRMAFDRLRQFLVDAIVMSNRASGDLDDLQPEHVRVAA